MTHLITRWKPALAVSLVLLALGAACDRGAPPAPARRPAAAVDTSSASAASSAVWVTVLERSMEGKRSTPEPFETTSDSLRVITAMTPPAAPLSPGVVITTLMSDRTTLPVASIRAEQRRLEPSADTTIVVVPAGKLEFFIPEHHGLDDWTVTIQELRPAPASPTDSDRALRQRGVPESAPGALPEKMASG
jgi:hypothetical protein